MKKRSFLNLLIFLLLSVSAGAQDINWRSMSDSSNHLVSLYFGADYSSYYGVSYGYAIKNKYKPLVIGSEITLPFGKQMIDDWRWNINAQTELWHSKSFSFGIKPDFIVRRYASPMATLYNTAASLTVNFGYVKPKAGLVVMASYDKPIATHIKNDLLKEYYPGIRDGWYGASGGNFKFGVRANWSYRSWSTFLTVGKAYAQNFKDNPTLPFFAELSVQKKLRK